MGTVWSIAAQVPRHSSQGIVSQGSVVADANLKAEAEKIALTYDQTFSDWSSDSELAHVEAQDLTQWVSVSSLFFEGLSLSYESYLLTNGLFDITVAAVLRGLRQVAPGLKNMEFDGSNKRVRFRQHPVAMTFGGIAKGMCVGALAQRLVERGARAFVVDAGGGNVVEKKTGGEVRFQSRSARMQNHKMHIINPYQSQKKNLKNKIYPEGALRPESGVAFAIVTCTVKETTDLTRWGAISDALSKAVLLQEGTLAKWPAHCEAQVHN